MDPITTAIGAALADLAKPAVKDARFAGKHGQSTVVLNPFRERQVLRWQEAERRRLAEKPKAASLASKIATAWTAVTATILSLMAMVAVGIVVISIISSTLLRRRSKLCHPA